MASKTNVLQTNNKLLNPDFDGYKLSCQDIKSFSININEGVWVPKTVESNFAYLYTRLHALHNYLYQDPFFPHHVYCFSPRGGLTKSVYTEEMRLLTEEVVWQADMTKIHDNMDKNLPSLLPPTLHLPNEQIAVASNGQGRVHILNTENRSASSSWLESFTYETLPCTILHSALKENEKGMELHIMLLTLETPTSIKSDEKYNNIPQSVLSTNSTCVHVLKWVVFTHDDDKWEMQRERHLTGLGSVDYCAFNSDFTDVILLTHHNFQFIYDSLIPVKPQQKEGESLLRCHDYIFQQNQEDVTVYLKIENKEDCDISSTSKVLKVKIKDLVVLEGTLFKSIDSSAVTWTHKDRKLEIVLPKTVEGERWSSLFSECKQKGEEILDSSLSQTMLERLSLLSTNSWDALKEEQDKPAYNAGELEACDEPSEDLILLQLSGETHVSTAQQHLGATQHLLNISQSNTCPTPSFCLRHDVDGVVWQPEAIKIYTHKATFHAFGYVRASKSHAKFVVAPSDCSYAAISDLRSHVYVFCQEDLFGGEIRNRKSGKVSSTVARQLLISLKTHDEVIGMCASPGVIFILTEKKLYVYDILNKN